MIPIIPIKSAVQQQAHTGIAQKSAVNLSALPPLSLYIHFPWCVRKCPYCDFNSHEVRGEIPEQDYLAALRADLTQSLPLIWGRKVHTVFIGGGTPSLLSATGVAQLLSDLRALLPLDADAEITLEANPGTVEAEKFRAFRANGINRLSLGIQSFNDHHLKALGRIHSADEARRAIDIAQQHFDNINLDLMFALPQQTLAQSHEDIEHALSFSTTHLSLYHLTLEPNTLFAKHPPLLPEDDTAFAMQDMIGGALQKAGFEHYEVSAYARPGRACKHNLNYWQFGDYLGIGAGAHGKISFADRIIRQVKQRHPRTYIDAALANKAIQTEHEIAINDLPFEYMLNVLRLNHGVPLSKFTEYTGLPLNMLFEKLTIAQKKGLLEHHLNILQTTPLGQRFLNDLQALFLSD
ncbi:MAG: oxygen-independent coproporphyrinogen III oxidase-like protein [Ottowia sp.]|nr:oxygen-independent coproporphyrinogen III oxidase-like protein [Ottowia sp.]